LSQLVRFIQKSPPYNVGEIAEFDCATVKRLLAARVAVAYEVPRAEPDIKNATEAFVSPVNRKMRTKAKK
jgi:hypothetical protein